MITYEIHRILIHSYEIKVADSIYLRQDHRKLSKLYNSCFKFF